MLKELETQEAELLNQLLETEHDKKKVEDDLDDFKSTRDPNQSRMHKSFQDPKMQDSPKSTKIVTQDNIAAKRPVTTQKKAKDPTIFAQSAGVKKNNEALTQMQNSRKSIAPYDKGANDHFRRKPKAETSAQQNPIPFKPSANQRMIARGLEDDNQSGNTQQTAKSTKIAQASLMNRLS